MEGIVRHFTSTFFITSVALPLPSKLPSCFLCVQVVHRWVPNHPDSRQRSHVDRVILLLQVEDKYVPIAESAVELVHYGGSGESSTSEGRPN